MRFIGHLALPAYVQRNLNNVVTFSYYEWLNMMVVIKYCVLKTNKPYRNIKENNIKKTKNNKRKK